MAPGVPQQRRPAPQGRLSEERLAVDGALAFRSSGAWAIPAFIGGSFEGGRYGSDLGSTSLPPDATTASSYRSVKLYAGTRGRSDRQSIGAAYGVEWGASQSGGGLDWVKQVVDITHELTIPVGDHARAVVESRVWGGDLRVPGQAPVGVRFFGGGREKFFAESDLASIRGSPLLRSMGSNDFAGDGAGATRAGGVQSHRGAAVAPSAADPGGAELER